MRRGNRQPREVAADPGESPPATAALEDSARLGFFFLLALLRPAWCSTTTRRGDGTRRGDRRPRKAVAAPGGAPPATAALEGGARRLWLTATESKTREWKRRERRD
uniref:Uncharacterized protein n=1 Tax=Oryza nivara TaxID=4536 RepID=A0A0E0FLC2_ORYNI